MPQLDRDEISSDEGDVEEKANMNSADDASDDQAEYSYEEDANSEEGDMVEIKAKALDIGPDGSLSEDLLIRREGWIWKKGGAVNQRSGGRHNWKKRWFQPKYQIFSS